MTIPNRTVEIITSELRLALRRGTSDILSIGRLLAEAKEKMAHGEWLPWLKNEVSMSDRSAQKYIKASDFAIKYELGADLNLSPSALFLVSRYDQPEIADAVIKAAREKHLGCDQTKEIIDRSLAELEPTNATQSRDSTSQHSSRGNGVNPSDYLLLRFTAAVSELHRITKTRLPDRFAKCAVEADILARLGQLLTDVAILTAKRPVLEAGAEMAARHEHV